MIVTKNSHRVFKLNVYQLFVSETSHIWHNIQESKMFQNLKGWLLERKIIQLHRYICGQRYLKGYVINGFCLPLFAWLTLEHKERHWTVWSVSPSGSFLCNLARIRVRLWPKMTARISHETGMSVRSTRRYAIQHTSVIHYTMKDMHQTPKKKECDKEGLSIKCYWSLKANHFCVLKFRNKK